MPGMKYPLLVGLLILVASTGCIFGGDSKGIARDLHTLRDTYVAPGLLAPVTIADRSAYQAELLTFRKRIQDAGGLDKGTLNDYVDGSLSLLEMQSSLEKGNELLETANDSVFECSPQGFAGQALTHFQTAKEESLAANGSFTRVLTNATIANELGVDFVQNVLVTTAGTTEAYSSRISDIKTTCGTIA